MLEWLLGTVHNIKNGKNFQDAALESYDTNMVEKPNIGTSYSAQSDQDAALEQLENQNNFGIENGPSLTPGMKEQRYFMALENQYNLALQQYNNAYNHPAAQMQRNIQAGLNPNLIYDKDGTMKAAGSGASPSGNTRDANIIQSLGQSMAMIKQAYDLKFQNAQISAIETDNAQKVAQTKVITEQLQTQAATTKRILQEIENLKSQKKNVDADTANKVVENVLLEAEEKNIPIKRALLELDVDKKYWETCETMARITKLFAERDGINVKTAIDKYYYDNVQHLEKELIEDQEYLSNLDQKFAEEYGEIDRLTEGKGPVDRLIGTATRLFQSDIKNIGDMRNARRAGTRRR